MCVCGCVGESERERAREKPACPVQLPLPFDLQPAAYACTDALWEVVVEARYYGS